MPDENPYDELKLREAYRKGHQAWWEGKPVPAEFFEEEVEEAFRRGYGGTSSRQRRLGS